MLLRSAVFWAPLVAAILLTSTGQAAKKTNADATTASPEDVTDGIQILAGKMEHHNATGKIHATSNAKSNVNKAQLEDNSGPNDAVNFVKEISDLMPFIKTYYACFKRGETDCRAKLGRSLIIQSQGDSTEGSFEDRQIPAEEGEAGQTQRSEGDGNRGGGRGEGRGEGRGGRRGGRGRRGAQPERNGREAAEEQPREETPEREEPRVEEVPERREGGEPPRRGERRDRRRVRDVRNLWGPSGLHDTEMRGQWYPGRWRPLHGRYWTRPFHGRPMHHERARLYGALSTGEQTLPSGTEVVAKTSLVSKNKKTGSKTKKTSKKVSTKYNSKYNKYGKSYGKKNKQTKKKY